MNISGIRPQSGFYDYNSIKFRPEINQDIALEIAGNTQSTEEEDDEDYVEASIESARENQTFGAYDFAAQYKPGITFELKGEESDLQSLDVANAISDMQRDSIIQQYQFFVGNHASLEDASASLRGAEDFTL